MRYNDNQVVFDPKVKASCKAQRYTLTCTFFSSNGSIHADSGPYMTLREEEVGGRVCVHVREHLDVQLTANWYSQKSVWYPTAGRWDRMANAAPIQLWKWKINTMKGDNLKNICDWKGQTNNKQKKKKKLLPAWKSGQKSRHCNWTSCSYYVT